MAGSKRKTLKHFLSRYALAAAGSVTAFLVRNAIQLHSGHQLPPYVTFYPAVILVALYAGFGPTLLATAISAVLAGYWILEPVGQWSIADPGDALGLTFFVCMGVVVGLAAQRHRRAQRKLAQYEKELALRKSQEALRESEAQFQVLANSIPQLCWIANADGWIFWYNERWYEYTGATPAQMEGWGWQSVHDPATLPKVLEQWQTSIATGQRFDMVFPLRSADGVFHPFLTRVMPVKNAEGKVVRWFGTNTDVTELRDAQEALRASEERLRLFIQYAPVALAMFDHEMRYLHASRRWAKDYNLGDRELRGLSHYEVFPEIGEAWKQAHRRGLAGEVLAATDDRFERADGSVQWVRWEIRPWHETSGTVGGIVIFTEDITERKQREETLKKQAEMLRLSYDAIIVWRLDGGIESWNVGAERLYGFPESEALGRITHALLGTLHPQPWPQIEAELLAKGFWEGELRHHARDGRAVVVSARKQIVRDADGTMRVLEVNRDITESKRAREALRESEERWAITLQSIGDAVISTDAAGKIVFMNDVAQKLTGWPSAEAERKDLDTVFNIVQEVTRIKPENPVAKVIRLGQVVGLANHTVLIDRNGTEIPIEDSGAPIRNREGKVEGVVLVFHDVSEQRKMEQAVRTSDRLATTGRLAATIAHEIHNPLDAVGNLLYLVQQNAQDEQIRQFASLAAEELGRVTQMTQQMLTFQRESAKPVPVQIEEILDNVVALYQRKIESGGIQIEKQIEVPHPLLAQPGELRQVMANLLGNAIEAVGRGHGRIWLRAHAARDWRRGCSGIRVIIADNGRGIPASLREKIFDPFFTTKGESGTGLGLWITSDIIRKYDGTIKLRSATRAGRSGTCFSIFLPDSAVLNN
jgi:PAS domain S-box-containing protein